METLTIKLQDVIRDFKNNVSQYSEVEMEEKATPNIWSRKEILGHLIDSALHNLRRFVAAHYLEMPFAITSYEQEALVAANHYQELSTSHLLNLWCSLNQHIIEVVSRLSDEQLAAEVINPDEFKFLSVQQLYDEYIEHLDHHVQKILQ